MHRYLHSWRMVRNCSRLRVPRSCSRFRRLPPVRATALARSRTSAAPVLARVRRWSRRSTRARGYVYEEWMGCRGSASPGRPTAVALRAAPVYRQRSSELSNVGSGGRGRAGRHRLRRLHALHRRPVVPGGRRPPSTTGRRFPQVSSLIAAGPEELGRPRLHRRRPATARVYVTWDYGPSAATVTYMCAQRQLRLRDRGAQRRRCRSRPTAGRPGGRCHVSPGFPASGGDSAPLVVEPDGRIDVLYQGYHVTNTTTYTMTRRTATSRPRPTAGRPGRRRCRSGRTPADDVAGGVVDRRRPSASTRRGNLYATWDTQGASSDIGWLSYSTDHGATWSDPVQVPPTSSTCRT